MGSRTQFGCCDRSFAQTGQRRLFGVVNGDKQIAL